MFVEHYRAASTPAKMYGLDWYARAYRTASRLGVQYGYRTRAVAAILAATSQQVTWRHAEKLTEDALRGKRVRHYKQVQRKVRDLLKGAEPENVLRGPKIRAFYRAIMGHKNAVVLDTWMLRAAIGARTCSAKQYRDIAAKLRDEARAVHLSPADFQAIVWCKVRGEWR